jgi:glutaredoxin 3
MEVIVYTKENCGFCNSTKVLLKNKNISFKELTLNVDFTRETLLETFPSARSFPVVVIDGFNIGGYNELVNVLREQSAASTGKFLTEEE